MKKALVIIPVFNEERHLQKVLQGVPKECLDIKIDTLVVNDGSSDASQNIAEKYGQRVIKRRQNRGYGAAVIEGLNFAIKKNYDYVVKMDADCQHETDYIKTVLKILRKEDVDYVLSSRYLRKIDRLTEPPLDRRLVNIMLTAAINKITGQNFSDVFCGFFGLNVNASKNIKLKTTGYGLELELILKAHQEGLQFLEIPHPLIYGESTSKFDEVYGRKKNLGQRLENYANIIMQTLEELGINKI